MTMIGVFRTQLLAIILLVLMFSACSANDADSKEQVELGKVIASLDTVLLEIQSTIGEAACSQDSQCGAVAIGHKPCGGPSGYLAYSTHNTDVTRLNELVVQHRAINRELNQMTGAISDCSMQMEPKAFCADGNCSITN